MIMRSSADATVVSWFRCYVISESRCNSSISTTPQTHAMTQYIPTHSPAFLSVT